MNGTTNCPQLARKRAVRYVFACLAAMAVFGRIFAGELALRLWQNEKRRLLIETLERGGCWTLYQYQIPEEPGAKVPEEPPGPRWLRDILGQDFFAGPAVVLVPDLDPSLRPHNRVAFALWEVQKLRLTDAQLNEVDLRRLRWLGKLEELSLEGTQARDEHLRLIAKLHGLRILILNGTRIGDKGLPYLKELKKLEVLEMDQGDDPQVTDAGVRHLAQLTQLRFLRISADRLSDKGVERLYNALRSTRVVLCYHGGFDAKKPKDPDG